jgi:aspartate dehydrogenase
MKKVGIIGCGAIGCLIAEACENGIIKCDELILFDYNMEKSQGLQQSLSIASRVVGSVDEIIRRRPAVIVEAASQEAVKEYAEKIIRKNIELVVMSTGALLGSNIDRSHVHVPSGAIGGLDAISSAALAGVDEVILTTRKNPKALGVDIQQEKTVYQGTAEEAVKLFPREMNVAATLALTVSPAKVKVKVVADPDVRRNTHEISVKWKYGEMSLHFENEPHPKNPGTSALAAWSAIRLLKDLLEKGDKFMV